MLEMRGKITFLWSHIIEIYFNMDSFQIQKIESRENKLTFDQHILFGSVLCVGYSERYVNSLEEQQAVLFDKKAIQRAVVIPSL